MRSDKARNERKYLFKYNMTTKRKKNPRFASKSVFKTFKAPSGFTERKPNCTTTPFPCSISWSSSCLLSLLLLRQLFLKLASAKGGGCSPSYKCTVLFLRSLIHLPSELNHPSLLSCQNSKDNLYLSSALKTQQFLLQESCFSEV